MYCAGRSRLVSEFQSIVNDLNHQKLKFYQKNKRSLRIEDKRNSNDVYARVFLLPEEKPALKRKTQIIKGNPNPYWQDTFDYRMNLNQALTKTLYVNLKNGAGKNLQQKYLGEVFAIKMIISFKDLFLFSIIYFF
jgi:hypothetical protein